MKIWELKASLDERFETLQLVNFDQAYEKYFKERFHSITPLADVWEDVKVFTLEDGEPSDCPIFWGHSGTLVFSDRAFNELQKFLKDKVEGLPLIHPQKEYYAIHVMNAIDAIDYHHAVIRQLSTGLKVGFERYAFIPEKVKNEHVFRIWLDDRIGSMVFVSDEFKEAVESKGLVGFQFTEVWNSKKLVF
ncbi:hypothetical protein C1X05_10660 [Laceyella sacchari]|nr:hypothetical protein C1X05_10660 [Laceyella sacchari]